MYKAEKKNKQNEAKNTSSQKVKEPDQNLNTFDLETSQTFPYYLKHTSQTHPKSVQTKLKIDRPGDIYEQEADRVADQIVRTQYLNDISRPKTQSKNGATSPVEPATHTAPSGVMRCQACRKQVQQQERDDQKLCPECQQRLERGESVQRQAASSNPPMVTTETESYLRKTQGGGRPLPTKIREATEAHLGHNFGNVRVHDDAAANKVANSLNARAFTHGSNIYLGQGESDSDQRLMSHELTHVVQQSASQPVIQRQTLREQFISGLSSIGEGVTEGAGTLVDLGAAGVSAVGEGISSATEAVTGGFAWARDQVFSYLNQNAPWLLEILRGGYEFVKSRVSGLLDTALAGIVAAISAPGQLLASVSSSALELLGTVRTIATDLASGNCNSLFAAANALGQFVERFIGPIIEPIQQVVSTIGAVLGRLWDEVGAPTLDRASNFGQLLWQNLSQLGQRIWDATAGMRGIIGTAWDLYKDFFDFQWDTATGVLDWLWEKAQEAWVWLKEQLGPAFIPVAMAAGVIVTVVFSPIVGTIISVAAIWEAIRWIRDNWSEVEQFLVEAREFLNSTIIPAIQSGVGALAAALAGAQAAILMGLSSVRNALSEALDGLRSLPLLGGLVAMLSPIILGVTDQLSSLVDNIPQALALAREGVLQFLVFIRPIAVLVAAIVLFPVYPWLLPTVLTGWAWRALPDCFKPGIIDFFLDCAVTVIQNMPTFNLFGEGWVQAKRAILETLTQVRQQDMDSKVAMSNRVARMMTGEDLSWIPNMLQAALQMPDHFWSEASKEFLGTDITEPLAFEILPTSASMGKVTAETAPIPEGLAQRIASESLTEADIELEAQAELQLEPELIRELLQHEEESNIPLGQGLNEWLPTGFEPVTGEGAAPATADPEQEREIPADPEAQLEHLLANSPEVCGGNQQNQPQSQGGPPQRVFGPFTPGQRLRYMTGTIGRAISSWFDCNKHWLVPALVTVAVALIVAEILTGGAITGALPPILEVLGAIFIGYSAIKAAGYVAAYVAQAINGNIAAAARSLARGLAIAAIELVSELAFPAAGAAMRGTTRAVKGVARGVTRAARATGRGVSRVARATARGARRGMAAARRTGAAASRAIGRLGRGLARAAQPIIRGGKIFIRAVDDTISRGVRSLRNLYQRLRQQLREFVTFIFRIRSRRFYLYGRFNPTVLLATGRLETISVSGSRPKLGLEVELLDDPHSFGIIIGVNDETASAAVRALQDMPNNATRRSFFESLENLSEAQRRSRIEVLAGRANDFPFETTTPAMRQAVQGRPYRNPLTNLDEMPTPGTSMAPDHIYPVSRIRQLEGFDSLTEAQQRAIIQDVDNIVDNIQPLPSRFNQSKGARVGGEWTHVGGEPLNPNYIQWLANQQRAARMRIQTQINRFLSQNAG